MARCMRYITDTGVISVARSNETRLIEGKSCQRLIGINKVHDGGVIHLYRV